MLLEGMHLPVTTPFYPDGRVYFRKLEHNVGRYSLTPVAGLVVLGPGAEASGLRDEEAAEALRVAAAVAAKEKVLLAGVGRDSVPATLTLAEIAWAARYDAVLVGAPATALGAVELETYFQTVADRSPLPVVLASVVGRELPVELLLGLAAHPGVIGLIDEAASARRLQAVLAGTAGTSREVTVTTTFAPVTGRMLQGESAGAGSFVSAEVLGGGGGVATAPPKPALRTRAKRVGFQILSGSTGTMLDGWAAGAVGALPSLGACVPQACYEVWQAWKDGDLPLAAEKQERLRLAASSMTSVAAVKHGCDLNGYFGGRPRLPLVGLTAEQKLTIEGLLAGLRN